MKFNSIAIAAVVALAVMTQAAQAQVSDSQTFRVIVPQNISITAPTPLVVDTHDGTDGDFAMPPQLWNVRGNVAAGVTVSFQVDSPFVHTTDGTQIIDASMNVASPINTVGPAVWTSTGATTVATDYAGGSNTATVTYVSDAPGRGDFAVSVAFRGGSFGSFLAGSYETTVTGTVTQN
ncbi:MAG: hypothetical protein KDA66_06280 [Planctomycetaceae bacterium]|nr:hypothetical protein [Planctomycetaceae bacterium]